jgi:hypothetical protein
LGANGFVWRGGLGRGIEALGLLGLEGFEGHVHAAADGVLVAVELAGGVAIGDAVEALAEDAGVVVEFLFVGGAVFLGAVGVGVLGVVFEAAGDAIADAEDAGFDAVAAEHAPVGVDDVEEQEFFEGADGGVAGFEGGDQAVELGAVLFGEDGAAGGESVEQRVGTGAGLAVGGPGAGGFAGVAAIGVDLLAGGHGASGLRVGTGAAGGRGARRVSG